MSAEDDRSYAVYTIVLTLADDYPEIGNDDNEVRVQIAEKAVDNLLRIFAISRKDPPP